MLVKKISATAAAAMTLVSLELALFTATAAAFVNHLYYQRKPCRRATTQKQVSFKLEPEPRMAVHASIADMAPSVEFAQPPPPIIGLLFAAGWCPDCTNVVPAVGKIASSQSLVEVVYVGSDQSEEELLKFKPPALKHIPIAAAQERSDLKRMFSTCAAKERSSLGISNRKNGIPTLILLESATGRILTEAGVDDVVKGDSSESVLNGWRELLSSQRSQ